MEVKEWMIIVEINGETVDRMLYPEVFLSPTPTLTVFFEQSFSHCCQTIPNHRSSLSR